MTFTEWLSLSERERDIARRDWQPFEQGYWHTIADQAAARFAAEFKSSRHVVKVFKSLYRARELIVAVQTNLDPGKKASLPESYLGFRVVQFAKKVPEGVLSEPGPPGEASRIPKADGGKRKIRASSRPLDQPVSQSHRVLDLEGEIDLHISPEIDAKLRALIAGKPEKLVLDLSNVTYIDSSGLSVLLNAMRRVEAYRGKLYLVGMRPSVRVIFEISRLDQAFRIRRNVAAALKA